MKVAGIQMDIAWEDKPANHRRVDRLVESAVLPDGSYAVGEGMNANGQRVVQGRVTSTYHSPTLDRGIAMGLVELGPDRMGEVMEFNRVDGTYVLAKIVHQVFFDRDGDKQNV